MILQVQPGRIDLVLQTTQEGVDPDGFLGLLEADIAMAVAEDAFVKIADTVPHCIRVALVSNFCRPYDSYMDAAAEIINHTGLQVPPNDLSDLNVVVNKPLACDGGWVMNRLIRLSVIQSQLYEMSPATLGGVPVGDPKFGSFLTLDFNNVPASESLSAADQRTYFARMKEEAYRFEAADKILGCFV